MLPPDVWPCGSAEQNELRRIPATIHNVRQDRENIAEIPHDLTGRKNSTRRACWMVLESPPALLGATISLNGGIAQAKNPEYRPTRTRDLPRDKNQHRQPWIVCLHNLAVLVVAYGGIATAP